MRAHCRHIIGPERVVPSGINQGVQRRQFSPRLHFCGVTYLTVYNVHGDGAVGDGRDVPDMLETFQKGAKRVTFNNIVGIGWSEFNVMEDGAGKNIEESKEAHKYWGVGAYGLIAVGTIIYQRVSCWRLVSLSGLPLEGNDWYGRDTAAGTWHAFLFRSSFCPGNSRRVIENSCVCGEMGKRTPCLCLTCSNHYDCVSWISACFSSLGSILSW